MIGPLGATVLGDGRVRFRAWAPKAQALAVRLSDGDHEMRRGEDDVFEAVLDAGAGDDYWLVIDGRRRVPDPCSRRQSRGLRGPSQVVDASPWSIRELAGVAPAELVLYELHVGTFTPEGTLAAATDRLPELAQLGITAVELMPVAAFPGQHGWGYDGVFHWAVHEPYGGPKALAGFVDAAHAAGLGVFLDVVYNHVGASGERGLRALGPYLTKRHKTIWGDALNFAEDGVREWVLQGAESLVRDYRLDGLRLDAIHAIIDEREPHLLAELARRVRAVNPRALIVSETGTADLRVFREFGHDGAWADDFHHALHVLLTGEREGYYEPFGTVEKLAEQYEPWAPDVAPEGHVVCGANHDQVGNRAFGDRPPRRARALLAFATLLSPFTPLVFMGEEYGERAPFQFFSDHIDKKIALATRDGRRREFAAFADFAGEEIPDPQDAETFRRSKLTWKRDRALLELHRRLLELRRELQGTDCEVIGYDERARWLRVRRGEYELAMSFASRRMEVAVQRGELVLATAEGVTVSGDTLTLPARAGAVLR